PVSSGVSAFGTAPAASTPRSRSASMTSGYTASRGFVPADRASWNPAAETLKRCSASWLRPAFSVHTNRTFTPTSISFPTNAHVAPPRSPRAHRHRRQAPHRLEPRRAPERPGPGAGRPPRRAAEPGSDPGRLLELPGAMHGDGPSARRGEAPRRPRPRLPPGRGLRRVEWTEPRTTPSDQAVGQAGRDAGRRSLPRRGDPSRGPGPD